MQKRKGINIIAVLLLGFLVGSTCTENVKSQNKKFSTAHDFDDKELERQALASVQEDIHLADLEKSRGEMVDAEGQKAVALSKQDLANSEIDKVNVEKDGAAAHQGTKPMLRPGVKMDVADAKFLAGDLEAAKEMHETATEDVEVVGKEDIENGIEDKKNAEDFMKTFDKNKMP